MVGNVSSAAVSRPPLIHAYSIDSDAQKTADAALQGALASCAFWQSLRTRVEYPARDSCSAAARERSPFWHATITFASFGTFFCGHNSGATASDGQIHRRACMGARLADVEVRDQPRGRCGQCGAKPQKMVWV